MLSREDNERLAHVGAGTPMGELLRRFWMPALLEEELAEPDGEPVRLRLLGEDLLAFRDSAGRIGIIDAYCAHRRAPLFFGRNEECGLRCVYHGWKFDVAGNCVDMPSEPPEHDFKHKIKLTAYRTAVHGGVIWIYMGPAELTPALPQFEWSTLPARQRTATKRLQRCNWAQAVEGGIDSSHISFLHSRVDGVGLEASLGSGRTPYHAADRHPVFIVKETPYGLLIAARRSIEQDSYYWRLTQCLLPFYTMIPPVTSARDSSAVPYAGHAWVPIDDHTTWTWTFTANPHREFSDAELAFHGGRGGMWGPVDEHYRPVRNRENDYLIDRKLQKTVEFTGIVGIPNQDSAVQEGMGPVVDRSRERLGSSDAAIIAWRRLILRLSEEVRQGRMPRAALLGEAYAVRSASVILKREVPYEEGAAYLLPGRSSRAASGAGVAAERT